MTKDNAAIAVAESDLISEEISYKLIYYNHYSMKGDIEAKKQTIIQLAGSLEGKQAELSNINSVLKDDLFYLFNNLNLRHNNVDPSAKKKYKAYVANMDDEELEYWYDETYQMCLLAFMSIENAERKKAFIELKANIEGQKA